ncbi:transcriptional regulator, TetR family [Actinomadura meyerae]|jgi:AcrR family transcriptional regulator|uniref:Transcriptional regulator, TetR family n=1 Tax=Actinomadura meyerae TaxID=240840 RepID=A0A239MHZ5_9ACTN|nr:TetR/AcrR family transcriptional regulator [Actinomadura meyerae]SNT41419.1 transcriptional regulator, TetR family [Actinomadura meyerae]
MEPVKTRRERYVESTRAALLGTGRRFFAERGFAAVSAEELVRAAGLTRGALYHHFAGKQGLFEAVFEDLEAQAADRITAAMAATGGDDAWERASAGIRAFLEICSDPEYREIVLLQGPIALGWRRWRELDQRYLGTLLTDGLDALLGAAGRHRVGLASAAFYGALTELALSIADADDPERAREQAVHLIGDMLNGIR